jgi:hypothetical protein
MPPNPVHGAGRVGSQGWRHFERRRGKQTRTLGGSRTTTAQGSISKQWAKQRIEAGSESGPLHPLRDRATVRFCQRASGDTVPPFWTRTDSSDQSANGVAIDAHKVTGSL